MNNTKIMYRIDSGLKQQFEKVLDNLGLTVSGALTLFTKAVVRCGGIPFDVRDSSFTGRNTSIDGEESVCNE